MNNIKSTPPPSPMKRGVDSHAVRSSPKKQRIDEALEVLAKPLPERSQKLKEVIAAIKAKNALVKKPLCEYVEERNIEGLKAAFRPTNYHIDNKEGIDELEAAVFVAKKFPVKDHTRLVLASLLAQIEDLELLSREDLVDFIEKTDVPAGHPDPVLCLIADERTLLYRFKEEEILSFISPIKQHTLLHYAAHFGKKGLYQSLVGFGLNITQCNQDGAVPVTMILKSIGASPRTVSELVKFFRQFYPFDSDPNYWVRHKLFVLFLHEAIRQSAYQFIPLAINIMVRWKGPLENWREEIAPLLKQQHIDLELRDSNRQNGLHWAVVMQDLPLVETLLNTPLPSAADGYGRTPLHIAAMIPGIDSRILRLLKEATTGAATLQDYFGSTALDLTVIGDLYDNFHLLHQLDCDRSECLNHLLWYSATNDLEAFKALFETKSHVTNCPKLLHWAVALGHHPIVDECLKHEMDWHEPDRHGYTPLALAIQRGDAAMIDKIYRHQATCFPSWDLKEAMELVQLAFAHPLHLDDQLSKPPLDRLTIPNEEGWTPLALVRMYGGPELHHILCQSIKRRDRKLGINTLS